MTDPTMPDQLRLLVTGANGQLGRLVVDALLQTVPAASITATVRDGSTADRLASLGVRVRVADYDQPATLDAAFAGIDRLLLISSPAVGQRVAQHRNVIEAARRAGVKLLAYTSLLHADTSPLALAGEHRETEAMLRASGIPAVLLRNGWYTENETASIPAAMAHGVILGSAGDGRISSASRADYAAAAAVVLTAAGEEGSTHELAGDEACTMAQLAAEVSRQAGRPVAYTDLPEADYAAALVQAGLPRGLASLLADSAAGASRGALFDDGRQLSRLIGHPTTPLAASVAAALEVLGQA